METMADFFNRIGHKRTLNLRRFQSMRILQSGLVQPCLIISPRMNAVSWHSLPVNCPPYYSNSLLRGTSFDNRALPTEQQPG